MKMLLIGELNDTLQSLCSLLEEDFTTQMCSEDNKNIKDMTRLFRPNILLFNLLELNEEITTTFERMKVKLDQMPMVIICQPDDEDKIKACVEAFKNVEILKRPVNGKIVRTSCFKVLKMDLPVEKVEEEKIKKLIMVVDDNPLVLRNIKSLLEPEFETTLATSGEKALDNLKRIKPDLILLDYAMPGIDGGEVFERMKDNPATSDIPVVFLTSVAEKDQALEVLKKLPFGYILKPAEKDKIISVINEALGE